MTPLEPEVPPAGEEIHLPGPTLQPLLLMLFGDYVLEYDINGDMVQRYRSGVPDSGQPTYIDSYSFRVTDETASDPDQEQNRIAR